MAPKVEICMGENFDEMVYTKPVKLEDKWHIAIL